MAINEILEEYTKRTEAHDSYIKEIENVMQQSREHIEELRAKETQAFNTIKPEDFKRIQSERATEEATIQMCERRLKELKAERLFSENELNDYAQQIYNEIEQNDEAAVKTVKKFMADMEKLGKEATDARARGNDLILKLENKTLPLDTLSSPVYNRYGSMLSKYYKALPKAQALYQNIKNNFMLKDCLSEE